MPTIKTDIFRCYMITHEICGDNKSKYNSVLWYSMSGAFVSSSAAILRQTTAPTYEVVLCVLRDYIYSCSTLENTTLYLNSCMWFKQWLNRSIGMQPSSMISFGHLRELKSYSINIYGYQWELLSVMLQLESSIKIWPAWETKNIISSGTIYQRL